MTDIFKFIYVVLIIYTWCNINQCKLYKKEKELGKEQNLKYETTLCKIRRTIIDVFMFSDFKRDSLRTVNCISYSDR